MVSCGFTTFEKYARQIGSFPQVGRGEKTTSIPIQLVIWSPCFPFNRIPSTWILPSGTGFGGRFFHGFHGAWNVNPTKFAIILGENLSPAMRGDVFFCGKSPYSINTIYSDVQARSLEPTFRRNADGRSHRKPRHSSHPCHWTLLAFAKETTVNICFLN